MNKLFFSIMILLLAGDLSAQTTFPEECSPTMRKNAGPLANQDLIQLRRNELGARASAPYTMRIQVVVFYKSTPTVSNADIVRNITNMANFYQPHNICFILSDIEYVRDSTLADFNINNEQMLLSYTRPSYITIFIHTALGTLNGNAYAIPNTYLSLVDDAIRSTTNTSTMAHEMGHCFGLYHTFETYFGQEVPARSGTCKNCETRGDFLCDTEADLNLPETSFNASCQYTGSTTIPTTCDNTAWVLEPRNIMTYGRRNCRDHFTGGQGARARDHILAETMLYNCIAPDVLTITANINYTGGVYSSTAKNLINVISSSYSISGNAQMRMTAGSVRIAPGTRFSPTGTGALVSLKTNPYCD